MEQLNIFDRAVKSIYDLYPGSSIQERILKKAKAKGIDGGITVYLDGSSKMTVNLLYFGEDQESKKQILAGMCEWGKNTWISWDLLSNRIWMEEKYDERSSKEILY